MTRDNAGGDRLLRLLTICGIILVAGYVALFCLMQSPAIWYPLRPDPMRSLFPEVFGPINQLFPDRWVNLDPTHRFALVIVPLYLGVLALITGPLLYLLRRATRVRALKQAERRSVLRRVFGFTAAIMLVLLFQRGLLSSDLYNYVWYSRIWVEHGASPYTHTPSEFPPDPEGSVHWIGWHEQTAVYGPAWMMISALPYKVGQLLGGSFAAHVLTLRLLLDVAHLLNAWLVWSIAGMLLARWRSARRPTPRIRWRARPRLHTRFAARGVRLHARRLSAGSAMAGNASGARFQVAALLFYIWNPLLLIEFAGNGHNDVVMLTFVLLMVWLHLKGRWRLGALALALAMLVKLAAFIFVPGYLWLLLWEGVRATGGRLGVRSLVAGGWRSLQAVLLVFVAWAILYLPFWEGVSTLQAPVSGPANSLYRNSLAADAWWNLPAHLANALGITENRWEFVYDVWRFLETDFRVASMVLLALIAIALTWRARTLTRALTAWGWVAVALIVVQGWFWPWYLSWALAPAAIATSRRLRNTLMVFTISALLLYVEKPILAQHIRLFIDWGGVFIMTPPLLYILFSSLLEAKRKRTTGSVTTSPAERRQSQAPRQPEIIR